MEDSVVGKLYKQIKFSNNLVGTGNEIAGTKYGEESGKTEEKELDSGGFE